MRAALLMSILVSACATAPVGPDDPVVVGAPDICRRDALAAFIGQPATQALGSRMLVASGARALRWVAKGMMVTMDYRGDRLTVQLDAANRVERANCG